MSILGRSGQTQIQVLNLHPAASKADVQTTFAAFGHLESVSLAASGATQTASLFYSKRSSALQAISAFDGKLADGTLVQDSCNTNRSCIVCQGISCWNIHRGLCQSFFHSVYCNNTAHPRIRRFPIRRRRIFCRKGSRPVYPTGWPHPVLCDALRLCLIHFAVGRMFMAETDQVSFP